jgi:glycosyltransferase involved in cell wall biosynthesis
MPAFMPDRITCESAPFRPVRRVLIVAPHFPPVNAPDHHRVRMALPHFAEIGWEAEVLTVAPEYVAAPLDPALAATLPLDAVIHRVRAIPPNWTRVFGWGSLARRAYPFLRRRGNELLARGRFDLVFFSTSQFGVLPLAVEWKKRHGVPYVLDFHDEWVGGYYQRHRETKPPGGRFKYSLGRALARWQEGDVVRNAAQIVSVSERYNVNLVARHPGLNAEQMHVLPFGGAEADFERLATEPISQRFFQPGREINWVYVGRGGPAMRLATTAFFFALRRAIVARAVDKKTLRLHFIGTDYAVGARARPSFTPIAREFGLESMVREETARVPHFTALQCLRDADALIVPGSDDSGYTASKIFPYILARRPLLGIFHRESSCLSILDEVGAGTTVPFALNDDVPAIADRIYHRWFAVRAFDRTPEWSPESFAPYGARVMTRKLTGIFHAACETKAGRA